MRISDWSSDVCSSDLLRTNDRLLNWFFQHGVITAWLKHQFATCRNNNIVRHVHIAFTILVSGLMQRDQSKLFYEQTCELRSEEHTSELQSLIRISYAVFCWIKKKHYTPLLTSHLDYSN